MHLIDTLNGNTIKGHFLTFYQEYYIVYIVAFSFNFGYKDKKIVNISVLYRHIAFNIKIPLYLSHTECNSN